MGYEGRELVNTAYVDFKNGFGLWTDEGVVAFFEKQAYSKTDSRESNENNGQLRGIGQAGMLSNIFHSTWGINYNNLSVHL